MAASPSRILVINPNSSVAITDSLKPFISCLDLPNTSVSYWTCPVGPAAIRTKAELDLSAIQCMKLLLGVIENYDGFLLAAYGDYLLVSLLKSYVQDRPVVGVFPASITTALHLITPGTKFAIVTTGKPFEALLATGVHRFLGSEKPSVATPSLVFAGVYATGIDANEIGKPKKILRDKIFEATKRAVSAGDVSVVCMGGVILAGMEDWVREACILELGEEAGSRIKVVEQMASAMMTLTSLVATSS